jgi:hypothetical protein
MIKLNENDKRNFSSVDFTYHHPLKLSSGLLAALLGRVAILGATVYNARFPA